MIGRRPHTPAYRRSDRSYGSTAHKFQRTPDTQADRERNESKGCVRNYGTFPHRPSLSGNAVARHVRRPVQGNASSQIRRRPDSIEGIAQCSGASPIRWCASPSSFLMRFAFQNIVIAPAVIRPTNAGASASLLATSFSICVASFATEAPFVVAILTCTNAGDVIG